MDIFAQLELSIDLRNPLLVPMLKPGLATSRIMRLLERAKVSGNIEPIVKLYSWRSGTVGKPCITMEEVSLFPGATFALTDLEMMIAYFKSFRELVEHYPKYGLVVGRYFPILWNGSTDFIVTDLSSTVGEISILEHNSPSLVRTAYSSFEQFIDDGINANQRNRALKCFE